MCQASLCHPSIDLQCRHEKTRGNVSGRSIIINVNDFRGRVSHELHRVGLPWGGQPPGTYLVTGLPTTVGIETLLKGGRVSKLCVACQNPNCPAVCEKQRFDPRTLPFHFPIFSHGCRPLNSFYPRDGNGTV